MSRLCVVDLDGVVCDSFARFAKAEEAKAAFYDANRIPGASAAVLDSYLPKLNRGAEEAYWQTAFAPSLVSLDTLIEGVPQAIERLRSAGYDVLLLTSRPESMREATEQWLEEHELCVDNAHVVVPNWLIMKPASQQFVKTITWKSGIVELLVRLFGVDELMMIDDEEKTQEAIAGLDLPCDTIICGNLQEAIVSI